MTAWARTERLLDAWPRAARDGLTVAEFADLHGTTYCAVAQMLTRARRRGDPRAVVATPNLSRVALEVKAGTWTPAPRRPRPGSAERRRAARLRQAGT
jgi:hypothetical protein